MSVTRKHLVRKLPRGYFGDCQITLPAGPLAQATPNFGGLSTSNFGAGRSSDSANNNTSTGHAADSTPAPAPSSSAVVGTSADGVHGAGDVMPSTAAGNASQLPLFSGPASIRFTTKDQAGDTHVLTINKVQLHAARVISGRAQV